MHPQHETPSPTLSAIMCDGMGWFSKVDYKRMLLVYDEIFYLLPERLVDFTDFSGERRSIYFPATFLNRVDYRIHHFKPPDFLKEAILAAASRDAASPEFAGLVRSIPERERTYAWELVNADGDMSQGGSLGISATDVPLAHAILLNKFLIAADALGCVPITGKAYVHNLISLKYKSGLHALRLLDGGSSLSVDKCDIRHSPVIQQVVSAFVSDDELEKRSELEIVEFKNRHRPLFERFSYTVRGLVDKISSLPAEPGFEREVQKLIDTDLWKQKDDVERELGDAWQGMFRSAIKSGASGIVALAVIPLLPLKAISLAGVAAVSGAIAPWLVAELTDLFKVRRDAQKNGLYYLLKFAAG